MTETELQQFLDRFAKANDVKVKILYFSFLTELRGIMMSANNKYEYRYITDKKLHKKYTLAKILKEINKELVKQIESEEL